MDTLRRATSFRRSASTRQAFTLVEAIVLLALLVIVFITISLSGCCLPALGRARMSARQLKCSTQVRGITQAMVIWASNNKGLYPLPSSIDTKDQTVADVGRAKDHTANIYSLLIFNGSISPEICICPSETNSKIITDATYQYSNPKSAVSPANCFWDPAFSVDFASGTGNASYAHLQPSGVQVPDDKGKLIWTGRMTMWSDTYNKSEAIIADRSPQISAVSPALKLASTTSKASGLHTLGGGGGIWNGNVAYNDNHVDYVSGLGPSSGLTLRKYADKAGAKIADTIFFDEPDDADETNTFLGIFTKADSKPSEFKPIWD